MMSNQGFSWCFGLALTSSLILSSSSPPTQSSRANKALYELA